MMIQNPLDDLFYLGVKVILFNKKNQILVLKMERPDDTFWELPGGRVQKNETEESAAHRELFEEAGISKIQNLKRLSMCVGSFRCQIANGCDVGYIFSVFTAHVDFDDVVLSADHVEYAWVDVKTADELLGEAYGVRVCTLME